MADWAADDGHALEDLSHDAYLVGNIKLTQVGWLLAALPAGFALALIPVPIPVIRLLLLLAPVAWTAWWLQNDGPRWFRRRRDWGARPHRQDAPAALWAPDAPAIAQTVTPLCALGGHRYVAALELRLPPFALAGPDELRLREDTWTQFFNAAAAHGVQVDVFAAHMPWGDAEPVVRACNPRLPGDGKDAPLRQLAARRLRHLGVDTGRHGYDARLVVRFCTGGSDDDEVWQRIQACAAALAGFGASWEWLSGAYLWQLSQEWSDPGLIRRRFGARVDEALRPLADRTDRGGEAMAVGGGR